MLMMAMARIKESHGRPDPLEMKTYSDRTVLSDALLLYHNLSNDISRQKTIGLTTTRCLLLVKQAWPAVVRILCQLAT